MTYFSQKMAVFPKLVMYPVAPATLPKKIIEPLLKSQEEWDEWREQNIGVFRNKERFCVTNWEVNNTRKSTKKTLIKREIERQIEKTVSSAYNTGSPKVSTRVGSGSTGGTLLPSRKSKLQETRLIIFFHRSLSISKSTFF